jgi:ankyrin repeat protein
MTNKLTPQSNLEALRKEAKRWLKSLQAGDPQALERLTRSYLGHRAPSLRTVQYALALEYGFSSWAALKRELEERALAARSHTERVTLFLEKAANRYSVAPGTAQWNTYERDTPSRGELAARLLARHPEIVRDSIHTAVAGHDIEAVRDFLTKDRSLADRPGGPDGWTPLLRLAYTRLPIEALSQNAIEIATLLLDHGANPKASWSDSENAFTVLTGVIGGGEGGQSAHPQAEALARLLIARGADPFDFQALYNTSLGPDSTLWLELLWSGSNNRGETGKWTTAPPSATNAVSAVDYLLGNAVPQHPRRTAWLLEHGANANAVNVYSKEAVIKHAVLGGSQDTIDLLVRHGAQRPELSAEEEFLAAAMQGDVATLRRLAEGHPEYLRSPHAMFAAIHQSHADIAELLLEMGTSPNVADHKGLSALHVAAQSGATEIARMLISRGANIDPIERNYNSTPLGGANYHGRTEMVAFLAPLSRDIRGLCFAGAIDRLTELLAADASLASAVTRGNEVPLFALPDDDDRAVEVSELLLAHGANSSVKNAAGLTPAQAAKKRGLEEAAAAISAAED